MPELPQNSKVLCDDWPKMQQKDSDERRKAVFNNCVKVDGHKHLPGQLEGKLFQ